MKDFKEYKSRSIIKAITYRFLVIVLDFSFVYILTRKLELAFGFIIISNVYSTVAYFVHERIWNRIRWGKKRG